MTKTIRRSYQLCGETIYTFIYTDIIVGIINNEYVHYPFSTVCIILSIHHYHYYVLYYIFSLQLYPLYNILTMPIKTMVCSNCMVYIYIYNSDCSSLPDW